MAYRLTMRDMDFIDKNSNQSVEQLSKIMEAPDTAIREYRNSVLNKKTRKTSYHIKDDTFQNKEPFVRPKGVYSNHRPYDY